MRGISPANAAYAGGPHAAHPCSSGVRCHAGNRRCGMTPHGELRTHIISQPTPGLWAWAGRPLGRRLGSAAGRPGPGHSRAPRVAPGPRPQACAGAGPWGVGGLPCSSHRPQDWRGGSKARGARGATGTVAVSGRASAAGPEPVALAPFAVLVDLQAPPLKQPSRCDIVSDADVSHC